jgi:hypothetical protein
MGSNESSFKEKENERLEAYARQNSGLRSQQSKNHDPQSSLTSSFNLDLSSSDGRGRAFAKLELETKEEIQLLRRAIEAWSDGSDSGAIHLIDSEIRTRLVNPALETREELEDEVTRLRHKLENSTFVQNKMDARSVTSGGSEFYPMVIPFDPASESPFICASGSTTTTETA